MGCGQASWGALRTGPGPQKGLRCWYAAVMVEISKVLNVITVNKKTKECQEFRKKGKSPRYRKNLLYFLQWLPLLFIKCISLPVESSILKKRSNYGHGIHKKGLNIFDQAFQPSGWDQKSSFSEHSITRKTPHPTSLVLSLNCLLVSGGLRGCLNTDFFLEVTSESFHLLISPTVYSNWTHTPRGGLFFWH